MAKTDEYSEEAYRELERLSADAQAKLEYEAREKAIRDYNSQMNSALRRGMRKGIEQGMEQGLAQGIEQGKKSLIQTMLKNGTSPELILHQTGLDLSEILEIGKEDKIN